MCAFCIFPGGLAQLGAIFCIHLLLLQRESHISKCETRVMLELFPNMLIVLEQTDVFKISVIRNLVYKVKIAVRYYSRVRETENGSFV